MQNNQKIPEGWNVKKLSEVSTFCGGSTPSRAHSEYFNGNIAWVKTTDLNNSILYKTEEKITQLGLNNSSCKVIKKGAVCVAMYGGFNQIGRTCLLGVNAAINQALTAIIPNKELLNLYLLLYLNHNVKTWKLYAGSSRKDPNITKKDIEDFKIIFPPLAEQEKIAGILGTWDEAIEKLSSLIEQKKLLKKGLMQRLLTGKTRLKGFTQPWKEVKLGEIAKKISDKNNENCSNIVTISAQNGFVNQDDYFNKFVSSDTLTNYYLLQKGDFGYNRSYSRGYPLGAIKKLNNHEKAVVSTLYICFRSLKDKINSIFLEQYFEIGLLNKDLSKVAQEGARNHGLLNITLKDFFSVKLYIPTDIAEQRAIADVLSAADEEIDLLNKKLEALKEQKKGLMQQLLTGQTRVKVN